MKFHIVKRFELNFVRRFSPHNCIASGDLIKLKLSKTIWVLRIQLFLNKGSVDLLMKNGNAFNNFEIYSKFVYFMVLKISLHKKYVLTVHNWQNWKRVFLSCYWHEIYTVEAVDLKKYNYTWKITIFVKMWNLGQFIEKSIRCQ